MVEVTFDPKVISYHDLLEVFWNNHNPTTLNRQGPDVGDAVPLGHLLPFARAGSRSEGLARCRAGAVLPPIVTEIVPAQTFWRAEEYHQQYLEKRGLSHCHI